MKYKKMMAVLMACAMLGTATLSGCGKIDQDAVAATIDGETEISLGYANFMARYTQASYDSFFVSYYGEGYWTNENYSDSDGNTMEDSTKESVLEDIELQYLLEDHMADYGVEITEEEQTAIADAAEQFMSSNSKDAIKELGATTEYVENMLYYYTVQQKMQDAIKAEADTEVSDEEAAQRTFSYVKIDMSTSYTDDDGNTVDYTEEELADMEQTAQDAAAAAAEDFDAAAETYGYTVNTYSYGSDEESEEDGGFADAVIAAADEMTDGDISGLIEGTDCYYIIRLDSEYDEEATEEKRESIISTRQSEHYTEVTDGYVEDAEFEINEKEWSKVKFDNVFTAAETDDDSSAAEE
jgi:foldase protein PrsA